MTTIRTCFWTNGRSEEAAQFYVDLLGDSQMDQSFRPDPNAPPMVVNFTLRGVPYQIINGGPNYVLGPAASISVTTKNQAETDRLWSALTAEGGKEGQCAWCVDRFGLTWQIVPRDLMTYLGGSDRAGAARSQRAILKVGKIDIAGLKAAYLAS